MKYVFNIVILAMSFGLFSCQEEFIKSDIPKKDLVSYLGYFDGPLILKDDNSVLKMMFIEVEGKKAVELLGSAKATAKDKTTKPFKATVEGESLEINFNSSLGSSNFKKGKLSLKLDLVTSVGDTLSKTFTVDKKY